MNVLSLPPINEGDEIVQWREVDQDPDWMNQKPRVTSRKEAIYGWYPPQWNVYAKPKYKQLDGYGKECLYKHWYQAYQGKPGAKPPAPPGMGKPPKSPPRQESAPVARRSTPTLRFQRPQTSGLALKRQLQKEIEQKQEEQQELCVDTRESPIHVYTPEPPQYRPMTAGDLMQRSWHFSPPSQDYVLRPVERNDPIPKPDLKEFGFRYGTPDSVELQTLDNSSSRPRSAASPTRPKLSSSRPVRSATVRRPKFPTVPDVDKIREELRQSATPPSTPAPSVASPAPSEVAVSPSPSSTDTVIPEPVSTERLTARKSRVKSAPPTVRSPSAGRPQTPTPAREAPHDVRPSTATPTGKEDGDLTYEELVDKYGWKVQIPGDPLHLKKNIIRERLPFTVTCSVPEPAKDPPKVHREVWDTFFLNTIPRKPATFTIAPDWVSEVLHAKRMELQKREGLNYRYKDFAFVY